VLMSDFHGRSADGLEDRVPSEETSTRSCETSVFADGSSGLKPEPADSAGWNRVVRDGAETDEISGGSTPSASLGSLGEGQLPPPSQSPEDHESMANRKRKRDDEDDGATEKTSEQVSSLLPRRNPPRAKRAALASLYPEVRVFDSNGKQREEPPKRSRVVAVGRDAKRKRIRALARKQESTDADEEPNMLGETNTADLLGGKEIWLFCPARGFPNDVRQELTLQSGMDPFADSNEEEFIWEEFAYAKQLLKSLPENWPIEYSQRPQEDGPRCPIPNCGMPGSISEKSDISLPVHSAARHRREPITGQGISRSVQTKGGLQRKLRRRARKT